MFKTSQQMSTRLYIVYALYRWAEGYSIHILCITCPINRVSLCGIPMSDIKYLIESDRWTAWHKLHITWLLPTRYSINITNISTEEDEVVISLGNHSCDCGFEYCVEEWLRFSRWPSPAMLTICTGIYWIIEYYDIVFMRSAKLMNNFISIIIVDI